jgi:predicted Zn-dependent protease
MYDRTTRVPRSSSRGRINPGRILIALVIVVVSFATYFGSSEFNDITGETQQVALTPNQEIALGLQAAPEMAQMYGGLSPDEHAQTFLDNVCSQLIQNSETRETSWPFECHILVDQETINAFALPGGQIFLTAALFERVQTEGQLAGVMAHEMGHVVARHGAEQMAEQQLAQGLSGAAVMAAYDPQNPNSEVTAAQLSALISSMITLKYGRDDELQSDRLGVQFMSEAGYDPRAMVEVMNILAESGGANPPEFFSTHPNPENRIARIWETINALYPNGVPAGLAP